MHSQSKTAAVWGAVLGTFCALLLLTSGAHAGDRRATGSLTQEFHQTYPISANGRVALDNINGPVHITAWDRSEVKVDAIKSAWTQERLDGAQIQVEAGKDYVSIRTEYRDHDLTFSDEDRNNPASVEYTLTVPRTVRLDEIKLINGSLDVQGVSGEVRASCINGHLTARSLGGRVKLSTINSRVDAQFERLVQSPVELSSVNGPVVLTLPSDSKAELEASTVSGSIRNDFGLPVNNHRYVGHDLRGELAGGGTRIQLRNVNGTIDIRHANDNRPLSRAKNLNQEQGRGRDEDRDDDDDEI